MDSNFEKELSALINKYSQENLSNTPNFILAEYKAIRDRQNWYGNSKKEMKANDPTSF